jgi:hypothetical protein
MSCHTVGSRTRDHVKAEPGLVKKIADPAIFNESSVKSVSIRARNVGFQCARQQSTRSLLRYSNSSSNSINHANVRETQTSLGHEHT